MIISEVIQHQGKCKYESQQVFIKCDECKKEYKSFLYYQLKGLKKYSKDLCRGCKQKDQIKSGIRSIQYINAGISSSLNKNVSYIDRYGLQKSNDIKNKISIKTRGENNPNFNGEWHGINPAINQKGKNLVELYGIEKSILIKKKISIKSSGECNPMFGKPSPNGSGNGWSGWYKEWFFRSLKELSYMIYVIERFNLKWENAEKNIKIEYFNYDGSKRTYRPDFLLENKYLVEIKPKSLWISPLVILKTNAALNYCEDNNLIFKIRECRKTISTNEIKELKNNGTLKFTKRYEEKFNKLYN
jgi:hypothetical protein